MAFHTLSRPVRVLLIAALSTGALILVLFLLFTWFVRRPFPKIRGRVELDGISAPVEIFRDKDGVPHLWAKTSEDLYFAQGWVHAQDRAWQMEFQRRVGRGRLSEILGEKLVDTDRYLRTLGFTEVAEKEYEAIPEPYKAWLESYAEGVNAYFESRPPGRLGLEFAILRLTGVKWDLEPWTPVDSILWGKMVTLSLTGNISHDTRRLNLLRFVGRSKKDGWYAPYRADMPVTVTAEELSAFRQTFRIPDESPARLAGGGLSADGIRQAGGGEGAGTNVWVLAPEHTSSQQTLLISDMHLGVRMPSIWHEIGLHIVPEPGSHESPHHVRGYMFTGIPGVVSGQNERIAWGQSNLYGDVQDYYIERINPDNPNLYLVGDEWWEMDIVQEVIHVEGRDEPVVHQVRRTRHGPVMTDLESYADLSSYVFEENPAVSELSMSWPALTRGTLMEAILRLNRAEDFEGFREALSYWDSPSINFVYADSDGNIGYQAAGRHPLRPAWQGQIPVPGWDDAYAVTQYVPFDQLPASYNPSKGYLVSCNNALVFEEYPFYIGTEFSNGFRARRISEIVEDNTLGMSIDDIRSVLMDTYSLQAEESWRFFETIETETAYLAWLEYLAYWDDDDSVPEGKELRKKNKKESEELELLEDARRILEDWDYYVETESAGAAAFAFVWKQLLKETFSDQLPEYYWPAGTGTLENAVYYLLHEPDNDWWDDRRTPEIVEDRDNILGRSLVRGLLEAAEEMGDKPDKWEWGEIHQVDFRNATLGESGIGPVEKIFNRGPFPIRGGNSQVHKTNWKMDDPFVTTTIPSQRAIFNTSDPSESLLMNTVGQSGHPFHRHYDDFIEPYLEGEYHPSRFTRAEAEKSARGRRLLLTPPGEG